jgi:hypothetical protein
MRTSTLPPRRTATRSSRLLWLLIGSAALFSLFLGLARPWYRTWGATERELSRPLPGDHLISGAAEQQTRAVTIAAPAAAVWPWVAQLGQDRAGFYSYEILEDVVGCEMPSGDRLDPTLQHWQLGDKLWMYPATKAGGAGHAVLGVHEPGHALVFSTRQIGTPLTAPPDGSWGFVVEPIDAYTSRLLVRGRAPATGRSLAGTAFDRLVFEPMHFAMERRMMLTLAARAEGRNLSRVWDDAQVLLWTIAFVAFAWTGIAVLRSSAWVPALGAYFGYGLLFQFLTLIQPSPVLGGLALVGLTAATRAALRGARA